MSDATIPPDYRPDIDGLRAIAVIAVVAFHAFPQLLQGGFTGVDVFFVISGYLITRIILDGLRHGNFSFARFYAQRVRRIFPALITVLLACLAAGWFILDAYGYRQLGKHTTAGAGFVSNLALWNEAGYFDAAADAKPLLHLWSLGIEEQFYILWPLLLSVAWRWHRNPMAVTATIALASFALGLYLTGTDSIAAFYSPLTRCWELMAGCMLACRPAGAGRQARPVQHLLSVVGLVLIALGFALIDSQKGFPGAWALLPVSGTTLLIAAGRLAWGNRMLAAQPLVWVGRISYPLYLWHWPLLVFAHLFEQVPSSVPVRALAITLAVALAQMTCKWIEAPVRYGRSARAILPLGLLMAAVGCAGAFTYERNGLEFRSANREYTGPQRWSDADYVAPACRYLAPATDYCMLEAVGPAPTIALVGDSFSNALYFGLRDYYKKHNQSLFQIGNGDCPPLLDIVRTYQHQNGSRCASANNDYLEKITADTRIKTVILAGNWHFYIVGRRFNLRSRQGLDGKLAERGQPAASNEQVFTHAFEHTVRTLEQAGKRVVFIYQTPELDYPLGACIASAQSTDELCRTERLKVEHYLNEYRRVVDPLLRRHPEITAIDPVDAFCDARFCYARREGLVLYRDDLHLSKAGSAYLGAKISLPP